MYTLSKICGGTASFRQEFSLGNSNHDLDEADMDFLSLHLASQTLLLVMSTPSEGLDFSVNSCKLIH